mmetsp:Transcript_12320/g.24749  ORF Transcript_12320/g.24749 Transcript_12320/m.24749 type:complete len:227 (-) Transcript_12320:312-992(-)
MPGRVLEDWHSSHGCHDGVRVTMDERHWMNRRGELSQQQLGHETRFSERDVRHCIDAACAPTLSLLLVRWGGADGVVDEEEHCGATTSAVSDNFINSFLSVVYDCLGPAYECVSLFVADASDLRGVQAERLIRLMRGEQRAALYFLWPSRFRDGVATRFKRGQPLLVGMVNATAFFGAMHQIEGAGIPTRFPHPSQLYAALLSKEYQASSHMYMRIACTQVTHVLT